MPTPSSLGADSLAAGHAAAPEDFAAAVNAALAFIAGELEADPAQPASSAASGAGSSVEAEESSRPPTSSLSTESEPEPEQKQMVLFEGKRIDYFSKSNGCWMPVKVIRVDAETGAAFLDVKPNTPLSLEEQSVLLRPRTQPGAKQLDWVRSVLREGRVQDEAEAMFERHARLRGGSRRVLFEDSATIGSELDAKMGSSGAACCVQQYTEEADGSLSLPAFQEMFWELLWGVQCECGQALQHKAVTTLPQCASEFAETFHLGRTLGCGTYGVVRTATDRKTGAQHAVKLISKERMLEYPHLDSEVERLSALDHPNIVRLYGHYEDAAFVYLVMDFCSGGELQGVIYDSANAQQHLQESFVACVINQVLMAISHVHSRGVLHLDLKPGNIMLMPKKRTLPPGRDSAGFTLCELDEQPHVVVIDLGVAQVFRPGVFECSGPRGTPSTMAPEAWRGKFTPKADVFSCGVVLFELMTLRLPFECPSDVDGALEYWGARPDVPWSWARHCSPDAAGMCFAMVHMDRRSRPEARQCLRAPFLLNHREQPGVPVAMPALQAPAGSEEPDANSSGRARLVRRLAATPSRSLLHNSLALSVARVWPANQLPTVERLFQELDVGGSGTLQLGRVRAFLEANGIPAACACEAAEAMDLNRDEVVDWTEFVAACADLGGGIFDAYLQHAFEDADSDQDGLLSRRDFLQLLAGCRVRGGGAGEGAAADLFVDLTGRHDEGARLDWPTFLEHFRSQSAAEGTEVPQRRAVEPPSLWARARRLGSADGPSLLRLLSGQ